MIIFKWDTFSLSVSELDSILKSRVLFVYSMQWPGYRQCANTRILHKHLHVYRAMVWHTAMPSHNPTKQLTEIYAYFMCRFCLKWLRNMILLSLMNKFPKSNDNAARFFRPELRLFAHENCHLFTNIACRQETHECEVSLLWQSYIFFAQIHILRGLCYCYLFKCKQKMSQNLADTQLMQNSSVFRIRRTLCISRRPRRKYFVYKWGSE